MSHFTVLVIGEDYEAQLRPYQENNGEDCPEEFLKFMDTEDEYRERWETESREMVVMPDGRLLLPWDNEFKVPGAIGFGSDTHKVPDTLERREVPFRETYETFEQFMSDWCNDERDEKTGRYGYWENPNKKWDWYQVGGRWTGFFKMLPGHEQKGLVGEPGVMTEAAKEGYVDRARKGDIDWEGMQREHAWEAGESWDKFWTAVRGLGRPNWEETLKQCDGDREAARKVFGEHPANKALSNSDIYFLYDDPWEVYGEDRQEYVDRQYKQAVCTFALVKDGKWYERGEMGWWAIVTNEKDRDEWSDQWWKLVDELSDDTWLTVVDCHI